MSRLTMAVDRTVAVLLALVLIAVGVLAAVWGTAAVPDLSGPLDLSSVTSSADKSWWPFAVGGGGALLVLLGLRWLLAHLPHRGPGPLPLTGTGDGGRLRADGDAVASAAAEELTEAPGVRSVGGRLVRERGRTVARLTAALEVDADLEAVARAADRAAGQIRSVLGRDDLECRVELRLARRPRRAARVV